MDGSFQDGSNMLGNALYLVSRKFFQYLASETVVVLVFLTLRASLSGTFLQTLPDLVTPLKGHSLSLRSCPATRSAPSVKVWVLIWLEKQPSAKART